MSLCFRRPGLSNKREIIVSRTCIKDYTGCMEDHSSDQINEMLTECCDGIEAQVRMPEAVRIQGWHIHASSMRLGPRFNGSFARLSHHARIRTPSSIWASQANKRVQNAQAKLSARSILCIDELEAMSIATASHSSFSCTSPGLPRDRDRTNRVWRGQDGNTTRSPWQNRPAHWRLYIQIALPFGDDGGFLHSTFVLWH